MIQTNISSVNSELGASSLVVEYPTSQSSIREKKQELKFEDQFIKIGDYDEDDDEDQYLENDQVGDEIKVQTQMNNLNGPLRQKVYKQKQREIISLCPRQSLQQQIKKQQSMSKRDKQSSQENENDSSDPSQLLSDSQNPNAIISSFHQSDQFIQSSDEKSSINDIENEQRLYPISQESLNNISSSELATVSHHSTAKSSNKVKKREENSQDHQEQSDSSSEIDLGRETFKVLSRLMGINSREPKKQIKSEEERKQHCKSNRKNGQSAPRKQKYQSQQKQQQQQCNSSISSSSSSSESIESISSQDQEYSSSSSEVYESSSVNKSYRHRNKKSIQERQYKDENKMSKKTKKYQRESSTEKVSKKERINQKRAKKDNQQPNLRQVLKCFEKVPKLISSIEELTSVLKTVFITNKDKEGIDKV